MLFSFKYSDVSTFSIQLWVNTTFLDFSVSTVCIGIYFYTLKAYVDFAMEIAAYSDFWLPFFENVWVIASGITWWSSTALLLLTHFQVAASSVLTPLPVLIIVLGLVAVCWLADFSSSCFVHRQEALFHWLLLVSAVINGIF